MSNNTADDQGGYVPSRPPKPSKITLDEVKEITAHFKKLFEDSDLVWWIRIAGIGALLEGLHILWLFLKSVSPLLLHK